MTKVCRHHLENFHFKSSVSQVVYLNGKHKSIMIIKEDPKIYRSEKTGRGALTSPNWKDEVDPVMTCYKLMTIEFKWLGFQSSVESLIASTERQLFLNLHRQLFCWTDKWHGMTMQDIRALEDKTKDELEKQRILGEVRGTIAT